MKEPDFPTHALRVIDNWDGEKDKKTVLAFKDANGDWINWDTNYPVLQYVGDKVLKEWELN